MIAGEGASLSRVALPLFSPVKAVCTKFGRPAFTVPPVLGTMPGVSEEVFLPLKTVTGEPSAMNAELG
jgi:hypothetical protein